jgi:hypothetical protein
MSSYLGVLVRAKIRRGPCGTGAVALVGEPHNNFYIRTLECILSMTGNMTSLDVVNKELEEWYEEF